jgi:hypothetical protein
MVKTPKLWKTCLGVRSDTDARLAKWKGEELSKARVWYEVGLPRLEGE